MTGIAKAMASDLRPVRRIPVEIACSNKPARPISKTTSMGEKDANGPKGNQIRTGNARARISVNAMKCFIPAETVNTVNIRF